MLSTRNKQNSNINSTMNISNEDIIDVVGNQSYGLLPPGLVNYPRSRLEKHTTTSSSAFRPVFQPLSVSREQSFDYDHPILLGRDQGSSDNQRSQDQSLDLGSSSAVQSRAHSFDSMQIDSNNSVGRDLSMEYHKAHFYDQQLSQSRSSSLSVDLYTSNQRNNRLSLGSAAGGSSFDVSSSSSTDLQSSFGSPDLNSTIGLTTDMHSNVGSSENLHDLYNSSTFSPILPGGKTVK